jgi:hypothetical protein
VPLDPYTLGILIGDGYLGAETAKLTTADEEMIGQIRTPENVEIRKTMSRKGCPEYVFRMIKRSGFGRDQIPNPMRLILGDLGLHGKLSNAKFVPECYKVNTPQVRLAILQGLLDTDGSVSRRGHSVYFYTVAPRLCDDVTFLVQSLGGKVQLNIKERPTFRHKGELRVGQRCFVLCISLPPHIMPFRLSRKIRLMKPKTKYIPRRYIVAVDPVGEKEARCISVAHKSQLYVTDDFIVTHNTSVIAAAAMKMKQAGLINKPLISVPNHLLEQFAREFQQVYPNAKLLVAGKDDFTKERRKHLTAKIASGDWDAIIVTHSSFERIGMSKDYQQKFLEEQIAEYDQLLLEHAGAKGGNRNLIKTIEKQKANREEKLKDLLAEDKKDDGLVFDELGVDQLFIDEFQYFKNLEAPSKMDRVAGIQTGGSERAFDMYMKARYLHQQHPGHGLVAATGTPISNSLCEMYTLQRYLDPDGLKSRGIEHFDAWAATFGEVVDTMEISPDGKTLKPRSRFSKFVNLPELQQMFRSFADVQTAEMLNLPGPKLETGKPIIVSCSMSDEQDALQQELVARYERIRSQKVDPREDNALAITTDGRKLALDARMLSAAATDFDGSKMEAMLDRVTDRWRKTADTRR